MLMALQRLALTGIAVSALDTFSAICQPSGSSFLCSAAPGTQSAAAATGHFEDAINSTGWSTLSISSDLTDETAAGFAAGFLEAYLTAPRISQMYENYKASNNLQRPDDKLLAFLVANDQWTRAQALLNTEDDFWSSVRLMLAQLDGLAAGMQHRGYTNFTASDAMLLNLQGDIIDIQPALDRSKRAYIASMTEPELAAWELNHSHCSALVKLVPDGSELFVGHNMWWGYYAMLRVFKHYHFPRVLNGRMAAVSMSSYPGIIASNDDFYQTSAGLVVLETTNNVYDHALYDKVRPEALMYFFRIMTANYLSRDGAGWMEVAGRHNSGTYNNMWMVVDYNQFTPGEPLEHGVLTIGEQLPGHWVWADQTTILTYGYWPSYNKAYYKDTETLSGQADLVRRRGAQYSYQFNSRAEVFRRDQATVRTEEDFKHLLRYNDFKVDPIAKGRPCNLLACRSDLDSSEQRDVFGAIDAKITSSKHVRRQQVVAISGPTTEHGLPPFDWREQPAFLQAKPHAGQPERFDFDWVTMHNDGTFAPAGADRVLVNFV